MRHYQKNNRISVFLVSFALMMSLSLPVDLFAAQLTSSQISSRASSDCAAVMTAGKALHYTLTAAYNTVAGVTTVGNAVLAVPVSNAILETAAGNTAAQTTTSATYETSFKGFLNCVVYKTGQLLLDNLTDQTVTWIKNGMHGAPYYAIDTHQLGIDLADAVAGNLARQIESYQLCDFNSTFKNDLKNWLMAGQAEQGPGFRQALTCPLKLKEIKASEFYRGVQAFSWKYMEATLNDGGNPFGIAVVTQNELTANQKKEKAALEQQLNWASGFLSVVDDQDCPTMPAAVKEFIAQATPEQEAAVKIYQREYCAKTTPAKLIEGQLTKATDIQWDRLGLADNLNKIINALITKISQDAIDGIFKRI